MKEPCSYENGTDRSILLAPAALPGLEPTGCRRDAVRARRRRRTGCRSAPSFCARPNALLYVATIAAIEVRSILQHCVGKLDDELAAQHRATLQIVDVASSHLWFPPGTPSEWDRHQVVLQRQAESRQVATLVVEPEQLIDDEIPYYSNPMKRLVSLHQTTTEMVTRLTYMSPWPHRQTFDP